ncbi:phage portal protein [Pseudoroseomonas deserti]|uniref:Phage portal protein n=1 Tax=Teichococcus deserti TaxID=1817963 RepID=A0A1V2H4P0_9PROT|nr:phage portal protein [Pseudoroseomonas deserti]ONG53456.1 phage portal protein [Pseudoroseomonas deserti]
MWPFRRRGAPTQTRSRLYDTWQNLPRFLGGATKSGVEVTRDSPITHDTVLSCYNVIAEGCAMLPLYLYREEKGKRRQRFVSREHATDHPLYDVLLNSPCPHMIAFDYWKLVFFEKLHHGNHYSLIERDMDGRTIGLLPVEFGRCQPFWYRDEAGKWRRAYRISSRGGETAIFLEHEVLHLQHMPLMRGADYGLYGLSVWDIYQRETIGSALATNEFASTSFANGGNLSGMIAVKDPLDDEAAEEARIQVNRAYGGLGNVGKIGVFGGDAKFYPISQDGQKAQLLETRKFNRSVIAGILRVTAHLINDLEKGTFSNIEHLDLGHYKHCLRPHLVATQQAVLMKLLSLEERQTLYVDHDESEMLRGDLKSRTEFWAQAIQNSIAKPDEARADFNLPPEPGGDTLFINGASVPILVAIAMAQQKLQAPMMTHRRRRRQRNP